MTEGPEREPLPDSIGGLIDAAFAAYAQRGALYTGLALLVLTVWSIGEFALPAAKLGTDAAATKINILFYASLLADSFVIAAVAFGIGSRFAGTPVSAGAVASGALARWFPVIVCNLTVQLIVQLTGDAGGLGARLDPPLLVFFSAPFVWLLWGVLSLAAPIAALSGERPAFAVIAGFARAIGFAMRPGNAGRLCVLTLIAILPLLLQQTVFDQLLQHQISRAFFLANAPIDALTIGPVTALQAVFAIDFARRAADQRSA